MMLSALSQMDFFFFFFYHLLAFHFLHIDLGQEIVNAICDDDDIKAISFVGPNVVSYSLVLTMIQVAICYLYLEFFCSFFFDKTVCHLFYAYLTMSNMVVLGW